MTSHRGVRVEHVRTIERRGVEALAHSVNSAAHALLERFDVVHFHSVGPGLAAPLVRLSRRTAIVQTVHGLDADREKWGRLESAVLRTGTWLSARVPDRTVVVGRDMVRHYRSTYGRELASAIGFQRVNNPEFMKDGARSFLKAFDGVEYAFNWFYTDEKDIAYKHTCLCPVRDPRTDPDLPSWGTGEYDCCD